MEYAELKQLSRQQATTITVTPPAETSLDERIFRNFGVQPDTAYIGTEFTETEAVPTYQIPVYNMKKARALHKKIKEGKAVSESDNPWSPEFRAAAQEYASLKGKLIKEGKKAIKLAGFGTNAAFSTIDQVNVVTTVLGLEFTPRSAIESLMTINTPSIELNVDVGTPYEGHESITEGVEVAPRRQGYTRTSFDPPKDIAFFGMTDEAGMKAQHPVFSLHVQNAPEVLRKIENGKIATLLETATDVSLGDWGARTAGISDRDPFDDIQTILTTIAGNGGNVFDYKIVSHIKVWNDFNGNTNVEGTNLGRKNGPSGPGRVVTHDKLPGAEWHLDNDKTATIVTIFAKDAFIRANGPTMVAQWRDENRGIELYKASHFNESKLVQAGRARDGTGVTA